MKSIFITLILLSSYSFACESITAPSNLNFAFDPSNATSYFYDDEVLYEEKPVVSIGGCRDTVIQKKYLMVALGLENFILSDEILSFSFNDALSGSGEKCSLENNPFGNVQSSADRKKRLEDKRRFINSCMKVSVTDFSKAGLTIKENQPGCKVTKVSKHSADFEGPFCFVKPNFDSHYSFQLNVNQKCLDSKFYKDNKINFQDVLGRFNVYTAGDDSGRSADLKSLVKSDMRISVNIPEKVIPTSSYDGDAKPTWPTQWNMPEIYFSKPVIKMNLSKFDKLQFPLVVNNICKEQCTNGLCASSCDFSQPVIGEFSIYESKGHKKEHLYSWYDGGVAPAQWQGVLEGVGIQIPKNIIEFGKEYIIEADVSDQELNYMSFKGRIKKMLEMTNVIGVFRRSGTSVGTVNLINEVGDINELPAIRDIRGIHFNGNALAGVQDALGSMRLTFKNTFWPPYFDSTCFAGNCIKQESFKNKIFLKFKLTGSPRNPIVENIEFTNKSNLVPNKTISDYKFPIVNCGNSTDDNNGIPSGDDWDFEF